MFTSMIDFSFHFSKILKIPMVKQNYIFFEKYQGHLPAMTILYAFYFCQWHINEAVKLVGKARWSIVSMTFVFWCSCFDRDVTFVGEHVRSHSPALWSQWDLWHFRSTSLQSSNSSKNYKTETRACFWNESLWKCWKFISVYSSLNLTGTVSIVRQCLWSQ